MRCGVIGWGENETTQIGTQNPAVSSRLGPANGARDPHFLSGWGRCTHPASAALGVQDEALPCTAPIPSRPVLGPSIGLALSILDPGTTTSIDSANTPQIW
jgi:hypothetical protein